MDYKKLIEDPLKSSIREGFFDKYKYTQLGNIEPKVYVYGFLK